MLQNLQQDKAQSPIVANNIHAQMPAAQLNPYDTPTEQKSTLAKVMDHPLILCHHLAQMQVAI